MDEELYELCMEKSRANPSIRHVKCRQIADEGEIDREAKLCYTLMFKYIPKSHYKKRERFRLDCMNPWPIDLCGDLGDIVGKLATLSVDFPEHRDRLDEPLDMLLKTYAKLCGEEEEGENDGSSQG